MMDFYEVLERVLILLQRHERASYPALKRQFDLDDAYLENLKNELLFAHPVNRDTSPIYPSDSTTRCVYPSHFYPSLLKADHR